MKANVSAVVLLKDIMITQMHVDALFVCVIGVLFVWVAVYRANDALSVAFNSIVSILFNTKQENQG